MKKVILDKCQKTASKKTEAESVTHALMAKRNQLTAEIDEQIKAAKEKEKEAAEEARIARNDAIFEALPVLLALVPEHDRSSCSEERPNNAHRHCTRCRLLDLQASRYISDDVEISIRVTGDFS